MEQKQGYYEQTTPTDGLRSLQGELLRSINYGDKRIFPDTNVLMEAGHYWTSQLNAPERSPRAKIDIDKLIGRIVFELTMRKRENHE